MPERWRAELRTIGRLHPSDDLVDRALERPRPPLPGPRRPTKVATIVVAFLVSGFATYGVVALVDTGNARRTVVRPQGAASTTNGRLLYAKRLQDGWSLFELDPSTGIERQVTQGYRDYGSDWSPDGTKIAYDSETPGGAEGIWVANADGSDAVKLADDGSVPAWSPDGTKIAFARADRGSMVDLGDGSRVTAYSIWVMNADGTDPHRVSSTGHADYAPVWSPDGMEIAFLRGRTELMLVDGDGSHERRFADLGLDILSAPDWSPDGRSLAVAVNGSPGGPRGGIELVPVGDGPPTLVPGTAEPYPNYASNPTWSPDGRWIAYVDDVGGHDTIVITTPAGSDRHELRVDQGADTIEELDWGTAVTSP